MFCGVNAGMMRENMRLGRAMFYQKKRKKKQVLGQQQLRDSSAHHSLALIAPAIIAPIRAGHYHVQLQ
jgi:hypothetical protein